jgi:ribosomal-protein-alanine N-acetyltransferase
VHLDLRQSGIFAWQVRQSFSIILVRRIGSGPWLSNLPWQQCNRHSRKESVSVNSAAVPSTDALIETPRLLLRDFRETDLDRLAELMANADFMRFSSGVFTREETVTFLFDRVIAPARAGLPSLFAVIYREENQLIGYCGFYHQVVDEVKEIEIGYRLHPDYWNRGLATEAARAVRAYAFEVLKLARVISLIHPENHASRRVTEKNGMTLEKKTTFRGFPTLVFVAARR